jgi:predicted DNA-binding transcriptional regulator AlpA
VHTDPVERPVSGEVAASDPVEGAAAGAARGPSLPPLLLTARQAAAVCNVSPATWWRWAAAAQVPAPVRIGPSGATVRWRAAELRDWTAAGCPDRQTWEALRGTAAQANSRGA